MFLFIILFLLTFRQQNNWLIFIGKLLINKIDMALEQFDKEEMSERDKGMVRMKSISNYVMGVFLIAAGCVFLFPTEKTAPFINKYDPAMINLFAIVCFIYGLFRIYRGYKKNYFRES